jgi:hypothetical protein
VRIDNEPDVFLVDDCLTSAEQRACIRHVGLLELGPAYDAVGVARRDHRRELAAVAEAGELDRQCRAADLPVSGDRQLAAVLRAWNLSLRKD